MKKLEDRSIKNLSITNEALAKLARYSWIFAVVGPWMTDSIELKLMCPLGIPIYYVAETINKKKIKPAITHNTEYIEFLNIYKEVLDSLVELTKSLDNETAMEHYALYQYMVENNYFSCAKSDNKFHNVYYERLLSPEYNLNNHGVCRHQAAMGCDLFTKLGFDNSFEICHLSHENEMSDKFYSTFLLFEELRRVLARGNENYQNEFYDSMIEELAKQYNVEKNKFFYKLRTKNNHAIMKVNEGEYTYFFDTAQQAIYNESGLDPNLFVSSNGKLIDIGYKPNDKKIFNGVSPVIITNTVLPGEITSPYFNASRRKAVENIDMLIDFKKENKDRLERAEEIYVKSLRK